MHITRPVQNRQHFFKNIPKLPLCPPLLRKPPTKIKPSLSLLLLFPSLSLSSSSSCSFWVIMEHHHRKGQKRKLEDQSSIAVDEEDDNNPNNTEISPDAHHALSCEVTAQVSILDTTFSWREPDRSAAKRATHVLAELAKNGSVSLSLSLSLSPFLGFSRFLCY